MTHRPIYRVIRYFNGVREYYSRVMVWNPMPVYADALYRSGADEVVRNNPGAIRVLITIKRVEKKRSFAWALRRMREGKKVYRTQWGTGSWCSVDSDEKCFTGCNGTFESLDYESLLATDWEIVP